MYKGVGSDEGCECRCHGANLRKEGEWFEGPAPRNLDRFVIQAVDSNGNVVAETPVGDPNSDPQAGNPIALPAEAVELKIDTGDRIDGAQHG